MQLMESPLRILEISIPHATHEGTLQAAMRLPQEIAAAGFNTVFLLPWMKVNRSLSKSPYAISDHLNMNDAVGSLDDARQWIVQCHEAGLRVVLDMPLNHISPSHHWANNEDWYCIDASGRAMPPHGTNWYDVVQLNHANPTLVQACEEMLLFWLNIGVDGFRFDAAAFIPDAVLEGWLSSILGISGRELLLWCDGEEYARNRPFFNGYLHKEAFYLAKRNPGEWEQRVHLISGNAIFYLTNHDTLHAGNCPDNEWPGSYQRMRSMLERSTQHVMLSWNDWKDPASCYSFMLEN
jgi:glycosidase